MEVLSVVAGSWPIAVMFIAVCVTGFALYVVDWFKRADREDKPGPSFNILSQDMKTGEVIVEGPDPNGDYLVLQKLEHDPGHQLSYEEVEKIVDESLQNIKAERMLKEFIARHRVGHRIVLHPERLMLVRLTDPLDD